MREYKVPFGELSIEFTEKRSRFIGHMCKVESAEQAQERIAAFKKRHWDATHNVWAYCLQDGAMRYSDDGEPQGTAGMPVLEVLRREGIFDALCVVTRYFGGIKLGAGGLTRAYAKAAKLALDAAGIAHMRPFAELEIVCAYGLLEPIRSRYEVFDAREIDAQYAQDVRLRILVPLARAQEFCDAVFDLTQGGVRPVQTGERMLACRE